MERNYETICIVKPDVGEDVIKGVIQKSTASLESGGGKVFNVEEWGRRKLAYPIQKKNEGYYFLVNYSSSPEASKELERLLNINEDVLRFQTVRLEAAPEKAKAEEPAEQSAEPAEKVEKTEQAVQAEGGENG